MLATGDDDYRKPSTGMWDLFCGTLNGGVQPGGHVGPWGLNGICHLHAISYDAI